MGRTSGWNAATREEPAEGLYFNNLGDREQGPNRLRTPKGHSPPPSLSVLPPFLQPQNIPEDSTLSGHQPPLLDIVPSQRGTRVTARHSPGPSSQGKADSMTLIHPLILSRDTGTIIPTGLA